MGMNDQQLILPDGNGSLVSYTLSGTPTPRPTVAPQFNRIAYAAAHVVSDPLKDARPWNDPAIDWDATMAFRHHLWSLGFRIAEAMDTSQRGMGLNAQAAGQSRVQGLDEALTSLETLRFRFWKPSLVQVALKARELRAR